MLLHQKIISIILNLIHSINYNYKVNILGKEFYVNNKVFNPKYSITSKFLAENLNLNKNDLVLDLGCGSGIQSIFASEKAKKITAVDINEEAVKLTKKNLELNNIKNVEARKSDLFSNVNEKFDVIIFSPPYLKGKPKKIIQYAWFDNNIINRFFNEVKNYLKKDGKIIIVYSSVARINLNKFNFKIRKIKEKKKLFETFYVYELKLS